MIEEILYGIFGIAIQLSIWIIFGFYQSRVERENLKKYGWNPDRRRNRNV
jgi:hypothetical protein